MKFSDFKYSRPDLDTIGREIQKDLMDFNNAESAETQCRIIENINVVRKNFSTMFNIASVNYSIDTNTDFTKKKKNFSMTTHLSSQDIFQNITKLWFSQNSKLNLKRNSASFYLLLQTATLNLTTQSLTMTL